jgi:holo-[acyl-carrier protein] synthase
MSSIGVDIEQISRIERALARTPRFALRVFTAEEREYCASKANPAQHYAARFCAKEALVKALGESSFSWQEVEVVRGVSGKPTLRLHGQAAQELHGRVAHVSLSHAGDYAMATVLITNSDE